MRALLVSAILPPLACLSACGHGSDAIATVSTTAPTPAPTALVCPSGDSVSTAGGFLAKLPDGFDTREAAVEAWLAAAPPRFSREYVISADGKSAWLMRNDGTAEAKLGFLRHSGFTVHGYDSCT